MRIPREADNRAFLAVMGIVKNEALNIDEWIGHYLWQGADHIFLINNGSTDDTDERISRWVEDGRVTLVSRPEKHRQTAHYRAVYREQKIRKHFRWLLIADADEFWFSPTEGSLTAALDALDGFDLVFCRWTMFGSAGHVEHPASLRRDLTLRQPRLGVHRDVKWAARTDALAGGRCITLHRPGGLDSARTVTETETLRLNHYITQSEEFWRGTKMTRGDADNPDYARSMTTMQAIDILCTVEERTLADMVEAAGPAAWGRGG